MIETNHSAKRRTRAHVIASLSINFVERFVFQAGHTAERFVHDYGYDLSMSTFDKQGHLEPGRILIQCKATDRLADPSLVSEFPFRFDREHILQWALEPMPVFAVLYDAKRDCGYWIHVQELTARRAIELETQSRKLLVRFPVKNRMALSTIRMMRRLKDRSIGRVPYLRVSR